MCCYVPLPLVVHAGYCTSCTSADPSTSRVSVQPNSDQFLQVGSGSALRPGRMTAFTSPVCHTNRALLPPPRMNRNRSSGIRRHQHVYTVTYFVFRVEVDFWSQHNTGKQVPTAQLVMLLHPPRTLLNPEVVGAPVFFFFNHSE